MWREVQPRVGDSSCGMGPTRARSAAGSTNVPPMASRVEITRLSAITSTVSEAVAFEVGVNAHKNDAEAALAVAALRRLIVRIKVLVGAVIGPEGIVEGSAERALDVRRDYAGGIEIWADLYELTSWPVAVTSIENLADLATRFGHADRLIVTDPTVRRGGLRPSARGRRRRCRFSSAAGPPRRISARHCRARMA